MKFGASLLHSPLGCPLNRELRRLAGRRGNQVMGNFRHVRHMACQFGVSRRSSRVIEFYGH